MSLLGAAIASDDTGLCMYSSFAQCVLYIGFCLCFIKSIMQMHENKGEARPWSLEVPRRLSFLTAKAYFLFLFSFHKSFQNTFHTHKTNNLLFLSD